MLYPKASNDTKLANAFADFFAQKNERIRGEIARDRSVNGMTTTTFAVNCLTSSSVSEFKVFKPLTFNEVTRLIKSGSIKSCSLDPLPASITARSGVILPKYLCLRGLLTYHLLLVRSQGN